MKKFMRFLPILLIAVVGAMIFTSCDDKDEPIAQDKLPTKAQNFILQYFPDATMISAQKDKNKYEVVLSEGTCIEFDKDGEWLDVEAIYGNTVPSGFYPMSIDTHVNAYYNGAGINEISKEKGGYDVELTNGIELLFNSDGLYLGFNKG